jgi:pyridoxal phosphate enzyme (YggS family)
VSRRAEVAAGLAAVQERIRRACAAAGRPADDVHLIVVTKTFPASDIALLADLGVQHIAENRHQEAVAKHAECAGLDLRWHFVGAVQTNKAAAVATYADLVHSVDRARLVSALDRGAQRAARRVGCLVQVSLDESTARRGRSGADPAAAMDLADQIAQSQMLDVRGVMGVAPLSGDADKAFGLLAEISAQVQSRHPAAGMVSAGMSGDLEAAISRGATHVRVGSAVLGGREALR